MANIFESSESIKKKKHTLCNKFYHVFIEKKNKGASEKKGKQNKHFDQEGKGTQYEDNFSGYKVL